MGGREGAHRHGAHGRMHHERVVHGEQRVEQVAGLLLQQDVGGGQAAGRDMGLML